MWISRPSSWPWRSPSPSSLLALLLIMNRQRQQREDATRENPYAVSTEGEKRCPKCGMGNLWTDSTCISCKAKLPG